MSGSFNQITIVGNLGSDPDTKTLSSGSTVCNFSVATSRRYMDRDGNPKEETQWHRITCWNKLADTCAQYLSKGRKVLVVGEMTYRQFEHEGVKRESAEIKAQNVTFMDKGQDQQNQQQGGGGGQQRGGYGNGGGGQQQQRNGQQGQGGYGSQQQNQQQRGQQGGGGGNGGGYSGGGYNGPPQGQPPQNQQQGGGQPQGGGGGQQQQQQNQQQKGGGYGGHAGSDGNPW